MSKNATYAEMAADESFQSVKPIDPYKAAEEAMQNYLDQDDGAEVWLKSISEIQEETDDLGDSVFQ